MKLEKEEFLKKINDYDISDEIKIEIIEDLTDSFTEEKIDEYKAKYDDLLKKYKERFFEKSDEKIDDEKIDDEEKIIDVKEI